MKAENPNKTGKFSHGGGRKYMPMWTKRTVTITPKETVKEKTHSFSFRFKFGWLWELALMAAIIYLLWKYSIVAVVAN